MLCQQVQISRLTGPARNISVLFHRLYLGYHTLSQVVYGILSGVCVAILWFVLVQVPYYARKLSRVKTFANWQIYNIIIAFCGENFHVLPTRIVGWATTHILAEKFTEQLLQKQEGGNTITVKVITRESF